MVTRSPMVFATQQTPASSAPSLRNGGPLRPWRAPRWLCSQCIGRPQSAVEEFRGGFGRQIWLITNPVKGDLSGVAIGQATSAAEQIQSWAPRCTVVKAFNQIGFNIMADPVLEDRRAVLFLRTSLQPATVELGQ